MVGADPMAVFGHGRGPDPLELSPPGLFDHPRLLDELNAGPGGRMDMERRGICARSVGQIVHEGWIRTGGVPAPEPGPLLGPRLRGPNRSR